MLRAVANVRFARLPHGASSLPRRCLTCSASLTKPRPHLLDELQQRGLLQALTSRALRSHLSPSPSPSASDSAATSKSIPNDRAAPTDSQPPLPTDERTSDGAPKRTVYAGVDPSARSLHVGNLLPLMALLHFARYGHRSLALIGGATGSIGDPSGRSTERSALDKDELDTNVHSISQQLREFFYRAEEYIQRREGTSSPSSPTALASTSASLPEATELKEAQPTPMEAAAQSAPGGPAAELAAERAFNTAGVFPAAPGSTVADVPSTAPAQSHSASSPPSDVPPNEPLTRHTSNLDIRLVNNLHWFRNLNILDFLGTVGRHARIQTMLSRDSVKSRLHPSSVDVNGGAAGSGPSAPAAPEAGTAQGLSFTEFSYQLLQAYDFSVLHGGGWKCSVQIGGSDQMGNIVAGVDLIRRIKAASTATAGTDATRRGNRGGAAAAPKGPTAVEGKRPEEHIDPAYGLTIPLLTTASGAKFGKSAGNAIWLSPALLSDFEFYQFFLRSRDDEVERYLLALTLLPVREVEAIMTTHQKEGRKRNRYAQQRLAGEVTELVRGVAARERAEVATRVLFNTGVEEVDLDLVEDALKGTPLIYIAASRKDVVGIDVTKVATVAGLYESRADAKRAQANGGLYLNNVQLPPPNKRKTAPAAARLVKATDLLGPPDAGRQFLILRAGRSDHRIVVVPAA